MLIYWARCRTNWSWLEQAPLVILVSLVTMAYGWSLDLVTALVAIVQIFVLITLLPWGRVSTLIAIAYGLIQLLALATRGYDIFLFWLAPAMLVFYIISMRVIKRKNQRSNDETIMSTTQA
jgi:ABC-type antimicrobial peptide transport system permease subunit